MKKVYSLQILILITALALPGYANHIDVSSTFITGPNTIDHYALVQFDLSWENSWRDNVNWDAAWVFVKYQMAGGDWHHAYLNTTAGNHTIPGGYTCSVGLTGGNGMGVFIYRSANGSGNTNLAGVQLRWEYGANGVPDGTIVKVKVFALEMVYIPEGGFYVGDADADQQYCFYEYGTSGPFQITGEGAINIGQTSGYLWAKDSGYIETSTLPAAFPKGYAAFYCMKYEVSQEQYADFLNTLTTTQDGTRFPNQNGNYRHTIGGTQGSRTAGVPDRACNYLSWMDGAAYADWAGLRPMTELEFEKVCRGTQAVVDDEYAWGNAQIANWAYTLNNDGTPNATVSNAASDPTGNASYTTTAGSINGPLRCGIFATGSSSRAEAGASYYGVMEMSGNLYERPVTVGNATGRGFTGTHGDGALSDDGSSDGNATNSDWPGYSGGEVTGATGAGFRGGVWIASASVGRVSARSDAGVAHTYRYSYFGFRGVRVAP
ncbi:MAG: SUMF1/EgtB/PvdO family nonheme iron enzyme [Gemmatimonadota bacterium]|nr:MAG: SUMF1/EgtB/PvdO family nonheme iron enzyme [Gemmatimonadota bacterium]